jgi:L-fucose isomerase-like protein
MEKLKVAFVAASMPNFSDEGPKIYQQYQQDLQSLAGELGFDLTVYKDIIMTETKAMEVRKDLDSRNFDFVLLFHPTYIIGDIVYELMKTRAFFGLWAVEETQKEGALPLASLVCLNQNTSIAGHYFRDSKKKFKWFFGDVHHKYFRPRFTITVKALTAIKNLRDAKVAQIGKIADGFRNMYYDERSIFSTLGVDVVRGIEIEDVFAEAEKINEKLLQEEVKRIYSSTKEVMVDDRKIVDSVRNYLAVKKMCEENNFKAVAFSCWPKLLRMNLTGCLSVSLLDSAGIPAGCEGDILSTLSMLILRYLSDEPAAVMDLPVFDEEDNSVLLWHCGAAPYEMAGNRTVVCRCHYRAEFSDDPEFRKLGPVTDMMYPESEVTVFRLTGESDQFYYFTGRVFDNNKKSYNGSRGWVNSLRLCGEPVSSIDLMNTILNNSIQHHFPLVLKDVGDAIEEFAYWLGLGKVQPVRYTDYLSVRPL